MVGAPHCIMCYVLLVSQGSPASGSLSWTGFLLSAALEGFAFLLANYKIPRRYWERLLHMISRDGVNGIWMIFKPSHQYGQESTECKAGTHITLILFAICESETALNFLDDGRTMLSVRTRRKLCIFSVHLLYLLFHFNFMMAFISFLGFIPRTTTRADLHHCSNAYVLL